MDDFDLDKSIAEFNKQDDEFDLDKSIEEFNKQQSLHGVLNAMDQREEDAKYWKGSVFDTPEMEIQRNFSPESMVVGMGMGGVASAPLGKVSKPLLERAMDFIKGKNLEKAARRIDKPLHSQTTANEFFNVIESARRARPDVATNVTPYTIDDYKNMKVFLSPDKKSGYAIKPDGELVSVFSAEKGLNRGDKIVQDAIQSGATNLDAFDPYLPKLYEKHGFQEYKRELNWTPGQPDVVYMARPGTEQIRSLPKTLTKEAQLKRLGEIPEAAKPQYPPLSKEPVQFKPEEEWLQDIASQPKEPGEIDLPGQAKETLIQRLLKQAKEYKKPIEEVGEKTE